MNEGHLASIKPQLICEPKIWKRFYDVNAYPYMDDGVGCGCGKFKYYLDELFYCMVQILLCMALGMRPCRRCIMFLGK